MLLPLCLGPHQGPPHSVLHLPGVVFGLVNLPHLQGGVGWGTIFCKNTLAHWVTWCSLVRGGVLPHSHAHLLEADGI